MDINQRIHINQLGYRPKDKKVVICSEMDGTFYIVNEKNNETVYEGILSAGELDPSSKDKIYKGDFSSLEKHGSYYVLIPTSGKSYPFEIGDKVYTEVKKALLKGLYFQRCGMELEEKHAGKWKHEACHLVDGIVYGHKDKTICATGGWHDAGDYGRYTVPGALSAADLMITYRLFPEKIKDVINIPESGNAVPDILNECRYELEWLLKMQDKDSGGVYHKLTTAKFVDLDMMPCGYVPKLIFSPISDSATGDFAAVMAMAYDTYSTFDPDFSNQCLAAALRAFEYLQNKKSLTEYKNPPGIMTGEYGDKVIIDELAWAAAQLYRVTGEDKYHQVFRNCYSSIGCELGWADISGMAKLTYLLTSPELVDKKIYTYIKNEWISTADRYLGICSRDGYGIGLEPDEYLWGSNMTVANIGRHLIIANILEPNSDYVSGAQNHLHYLLGRNSLNQCFITGFGSKPILNPHHRPSVADGITKPVPGLLSGGPNKGLHDDYAKNHLMGLPPAKCFADHEDSYSTNEVAIYWNTPALFLAAYFD
ncbi:MAG: glycoside hydrolase [Epulopiscium sp.]|nr:glycoside hydrolase [Candidatus Epulonipiscium sp.]